MFSAVGVKESTRFNSIFTIINLVVVLYAVIVGSFKLNFHNWNLSYDEVPHGDGKDKDPPNGGKGGFFLFGIEGMMQGAATCFYA